MAALDQPCLQAAELQMLRARRGSYGQQPWGLPTVDRLAKTWLERQNCQR